MGKFSIFIGIILYYLFCIALGLYIMSAISGCTIPDLRHPGEMIILGHPIGITGPQFTPTQGPPNPWVYPDSVFCKWHPDLCTGSNDI